MDTNNLRYVELFAGVGGFRLGIERACEPLGIIPDCVFASEWDKFAAVTYNKNFGGSIDERDISTIPTSDIPDHDLLVGGFPCQTFSIAGKRAGFADTRGTMFFEIARILADKQPRHLLLENVRGLLSHNKGRTFKRILGILADLGYRVQWQVLNSKSFGVPQNRERVYFTGHLGGESGHEIFPIIRSEYRASRTGKPEIRPRIIASRRHYREGRRSLDYSLVDDVPTITASRGNLPRLLHNGRIRHLTPLECERLQGFPDGWTDGGSDTQRYKQMGNAVTVNVVQAVVTQLLACS